MEVALCCGAAASLSPVRAPGAQTALPWPGAHSWLCQETPREPRLAPEPSPDPAAPYGRATSPPCGQVHSLGSLRGHPEPGAGLAVAVGTRSRRWSPPVPPPVSLVSGSAAADNVILHKWTLLSSSCANEATSP